MMSNVAGAARGVEEAAGVSTTAEAKFRNLSCHRVKKLGRRKVPSMYMRYCPAHSFLFCTL